MKRFAVFGNPAEHSLSPGLHLLFGERTGIALSYSKHTIAPDDFESQVDSFFASGGNGLNITLPFKQRAFEHCVRLSERARTAGAVNTLWHKNGVLEGDNTDGIGLITDLENRLGWKISGTRVLILGAGGSVRGIIHSLLASEPASLTIANRTRAKAQELVEIGQADYPEVKINACGFDQCDQSYNYIINATSISLGNQQLPFSPAILVPHTACYDLAYSTDGETRFCRWARQNGCANTSDGLGMLVEQGAESFRIWLGTQPDTSGIVTQLRQQH